MERKVLNVEPEKARKRSVLKTLQKKAAKKEKLYSAPGLPKKTNCGHNSKSLKCMSLTGRDIFYFHKNLFATPSKINQDNFILMNITVTKIKRRRPRTGINRAKTCNVKYFVPNSITKNPLPVCKKTFLNATRINENRIRGVINRFFETGCVAKENRGGDRKRFEYASKAEAVEKFIKSFKPLQSHYCREQIKVRQYLHPNLNIRKMFIFYNDQALPGFGVKECFFRKIFNTRFNIGFDSPRTDVCSFCLQMTERIKIETSQEKKQEVMTQLRIHKLRAKQFYKMLQEESPGILVLSFDCEKNLPLPKIPDQATYYSRQLYLYNFTVVIGSSRAPLTSNNVHAYVWTEDEAAKGSNEICSTLYHCLNSIDLTNISKIRLISDGCGGQNKNSIIICMVMKWLIETTTDIKDIEMIFPVTGHSFMPADRVFALNERQIRKMENIITPDEYESIIKQHATVHKLGTDIQIYDWKTKSKEFLKNTQSWHFQISKCKRIIFHKSTNKVHIRGEISYRNDMTEFQSITKRGKKINDIQLDQIPIGVPVKAAKLNDVDNLLKKHYGEEWKDLGCLMYYKNVLDRGNENDVPVNDDSEVEIGDSENIEIIDFV